MSYCTADVTITTSSSYCGGLIGYVTGKVENSSAKGTITSSSTYSAGFIGHTSSSPTITGCYSLVNVISTGNYSAGFVARMSGGTFSECYASGNISGTANYKGGFAANIDGGPTITSCYAAGDVSGNTYNGGFIGQIASASAVTISKCYSSGDVTSTGNYAGGFASYVYVTGAVNIEINNSYSTGNVTGKVYTGGFIGYENTSNTGATYKVSVMNCYSNGKVTGTTDTGAFVGLVLAGAAGISNTNCYFIPETAGTTVSAAGNPIMVNYAPIRTSYATWDFGAIWDNINTGNDQTMPYLKGLPIPDGVYLSNLDYYRLDGLGTTDNPFLIYSSVDLDIVRNYPTYSFKLMNDIDMSSYASFEPIVDYKGTFDGNGKKIANLKISKSGVSNVGLFANTIAGSVIKDLILEDVSVIGGSYTGALVGESVGNIYNVIVIGEVKAPATNVGGLVGRKNGGLIENCYTAGNITGASSNVGGIAGVSTNSASITSSYSKMNITASGNSIGGLIGQATAGVTIGSSYATRKCKWKRFCWRIGRKCKYGKCSYNQ